MPKRIPLIQGLPDKNEPHLYLALASSYNNGAAYVGDTVTCSNVAALDFPVLRSQKYFETGTLPISLKPVQEDIMWAAHIVFIFPIWAGDTPALLKVFLE